MFTYSITFDVVTPESAENGDFAESGFISQDDVAETLADLADAISDNCGHVEANVYPFPAHGPIGSLAFYGVDPDVDYSTGAETRRALHVDNISADDARALVRLLMGRGLLPSSAVRA
jgi:hypothetical protein